MSLEIEILVKNYPPTVFSIGYLNIDLLFPDFSLAKDGEREMLSRLPTRYRKTVGE
jgi:hypothetical protein